MSTTDETKPHPARTAWELAQRIFHRRDPSIRDAARLDLFAPTSEQVDFEIAIAEAVACLNVSGTKLGRETAEKLRRYSRRAVLAAQEFPLPARVKVPLRTLPDAANPETLAAAPGAADATREAA